MSFEYAEGKGALFKNERKRSGSSPDWSGKIKINGKLYMLGAWIKNDTMFTLSAMADGQAKETKPAKPKSYYEQGWR